MNTFLPLVAALLTALVLTACGKNDPQVSGLSNAPDCSTTEEQVSAEIELRRRQEKALLKLLRSPEGADKKTSAIDAMIREEQDFDRRNGQFCRDFDGHYRSVQIHKDILDLLREGRGDVILARPISRSLVNALDSQALRTEASALSFAEKLTRSLQENCGLELKIQPKGETRAVTVVSKTRIEAAVQLATAPLNASTTDLENMIARLSEAVSSLTPEMIETLGNAGSDAQGWTMARGYLEKLGLNLADLRKNLDKYREKGAVLPNYWPAE